MSLVTLVSLVILVSLVTLVTSVASPVAKDHWVTRWPLTTVQITSLVGNITFLGALS